MKKKITYLIVFGLIIGAGFLFYQTDRNGGRLVDSVLASTDITVYKTLTCGCCVNYIGYATRQGLEIKAETVNNLEQIKMDYEIPEDMWSCHTSIMGDYIVEGHIPLEAVEKLVSEKPDIRGIAMPGMPSGSPGMPGSKTGPFEIYSLNHDGSTSLFMSL